MMKKLSGILVIMLASWLMLSGRVAAEQPNDELTEETTLIKHEFFSDGLTGWELTGQSELMATSDRSAALTLHPADGTGTHARLQTVSTLNPDAPTPPLYFHYDFDFSLAGFSGGDSFEIVYNTPERGYYYSFVCALTEDANYLRCEHQHNFYGNRQTVATGGALRAACWQDQQRLQFSIDVTANGIMALLARVGDDSDCQTQIGNLYNPPGSWLRDPKHAPEIQLYTSQIADPEASLSVYRVLYTAQGYTYQNSAVQRLSQLDTRWRDVLLGHTSDQTIGQIGCLLVDVVMILRAHGYDQLPASLGGGELTPVTLNDWLKSQPDGYVNKNLLNMAAVTRLSNYLHADYASRGITLPKFEYRRATNVDANQLAWSLNLHGEPFIIQIPGHFVVVNGAQVNTGYQNRIVDPYYERDTVALPVNTLRSVNRLVPSFTDQSYLIVNLIGDGQFFVGSQNQWPFLQTLYDPLTDEAVGQQWLIAQPDAADSLTLRFVNNSTESDLSVSIMAYNRQGEVRVVSQEVSDSWRETFSYDPDGDQQTVLVSKHEQLTWEQIMASTRWQFVNWNLDNLYQGRQFQLLLAVIADYHDRSLLSDEENERLVELVSALL